MNSLARKVVFILAAIWLTSTALAQVPGGAPPFSTTAGGPEVIDLGNSNIQLRIPVLVKPGRGLPFSYALSFDNSIWYPVTSNGVESWQPTYNWGWRAVTEASTGYFSYSVTDGLCLSGGVPYGMHFTYFNFAYHDPWGATHPTPGSAYQGCTAKSTSYYGTATDGSGYSISWNSSNGSVATVTTRAGKIFNVPNTGTGAATHTDDNGNQITVNSSGVFTDTLGSTALTVSGSQPNPVTFAYTPPSGGSPVNVTVNYGSYTVRTNFGCSGISEFGPATESLVSSISLPDGSSYVFNYEPTPGYSGDVTGRLASVQLPTGGVITYTYSGGSNNSGIFCSDGSTATLMRTTPDGSWAYARTQGTGAASTNTITDPNGNQTVLQFQGIYETQRQVYQGSTSGTLLESVQKCYNGAAAPCTGTSIVQPITKVTSTLQWPNGQQSKVDSFYNSYGLLAEEDDYDYGNNAPGGLIRKQIITYDTALNNGIVDRPSEIDVYDGGGTLQARTTYSYDETAVTSTSGVPQHIAISGSRGNLTSIHQCVQAPTCSTFRTTTVTYNDTGDVLTVTDAANNQTTIDYTDNYSDGVNHGTLAFPTTITYPNTGVAHVVHRKYFWPAALLDQSTGQNGNTAAYAYDEMMRPTQVLYPDGGETDWTYSPWSGFSPHAEISVQRKLTTTPTWVTSTTLLDGLGRVSQTQQTSNPIGTIYADTSYDSLGRTYCVSNSYHTTSDPTYGNTCYNYDPLGRPTKVTNPDGTYATASYTGRAAEIADEGNGSYNVTHIYQVDGLGRMTSACEVTGTTYIGSPAPAACGLDIAGTGYLTSYQYDTLGDLTQVAQGSQTRAFTYNSLGQLTSEKVPELITGGMQGVISYSYDSDGRLYQRTSPEPNQTSPTTTVTATYAYDALSRLTGISYNDGTTASASFQYDQSTAWNNSLSNPIGRLTYSSRGSTGAVFSYDSMGRVAGNWQCTPYNCGSGSWNLTYGYNPLGEPTSMYGSFNGATQTYNYNGAGQLAGITSTLNDANHPGTLLSAINYNSLGELVSDSLGNGITESVAYDKLGRVTSTSAMKGSTTIYSLSNVSYKPDSDLASDNDSANGNWTYGFDALDRISSAGTNTFDTDAFGNRWHQNPSGAQLSFDTAANRIAGGNGVTYDAAGNITNDGDHTYTYDAESRIVSVDGGSTATYVYDAFGRRVRDTNNVAGTLDFLYGLGGNPVAAMTGSGGWYRGEVWVGGRHLATYAGGASGTTYFSHQDWEGTDRVRSDVNGNTYQTCTSGPYGDNYSCSPGGISTIGYTGLDQDTESGLMHAWFRYYNPRLGVWMSSDPAGLAAIHSSDPQSFNRYAYVDNMPVNSTDSLGLVTPMKFNVWSGGGGSGGCGLFISMCQLSGGCEIDGLDAPCFVAQGLASTGAASVVPSGFVPTGFINGVPYIAVATWQGLGFAYFGCNARALGLNYCNNEGYAEVLGLPTFFPDSPFALLNVPMPVSYANGGPMMSRAPQKGRLTVNAANAICTVEALNATNGLGLSTPILSPSGSDAIAAQAEIYQSTGQQGKAVAPGELPPGVEVTIMNPSGASAAGALAALAPPGIFLTNSYYQCMSKLGF